MVRFGKWIRLVSGGSNPASETSGGLASAARAVAPWNASGFWKGITMARTMAETNETDALKRQTFRFSAPTAMSVQLVGDFTQWQKNAIPMQKDKAGIWTASVALPAGKHTYRFVVDGEWRDDPECTLRVANPYGTHNMVRQVT